MLILDISYDVPSKRHRTVVGFLYSSHISACPTETSTATCMQAQFLAGQMKPRHDSPRAPDRHTHIRVATFYSVQRVITLCLVRCNLLL